MAELIKQIKEAIKGKDLARLTWNQAYAFMQPKCTRTVFEEAWAAVMHDTNPNPTDEQKAAQAAAKKS